MWQCLMQLLILRSHNYIVYELSSNGVELCLTFNKKRSFINQICYIPLPSITYLCKHIRYTHIVQYVYTMMQYQLQDNVSVQQAEHVRKLLDIYLNIVHFFLNVLFRKQ